MIDETPKHYTDTEKTNRKGSKHFATWSRICVTLHSL